MTKSRWRNRWARLINETLAALPSGHGLADARKALRQVRLSQRQGWAYQAWLKEKRTALARYEKPQVVEEVNRCTINTRSLCRMCMHCHYRKASPRGLCFACRSKREIQALYPPTSAHARHGLGQTAAMRLPKPTTALPGTEAKVLVLIARAAANELLFHPHDARADDT